MPATPCSNDRLERTIVGVNLLERDLYRRLQGAATTNSVHTTLPTAQSARDLTKVSCSDDATAASVWIVELRGIAQLEGFETSLQCSLMDFVEALEHREIVLNITRPTELVSSRIAELARRHGAASRLGKRGCVKPVRVGADPMSDLVRSCQVCSLRRSRSIQSAAICIDGERSSRNHRDDTRELPAAKSKRRNSRVQTVMTAPKGQLICKALFVI